MWLNSVISCTCFVEMFTVEMTRNLTTIMRTHVQCWYTVSILSFKKEQCNYKPVFLLFSRRLEHETVGNWIKREPESYAISTSGVSRMFSFCGIIAESIINCLLIILFVITKDIPLTFTWNINIHFLNKLFFFFWKKNEGNP